MEQINGGSAKLKAFLDSRKGKEFEPDEVLEDHQNQARRRLMNSEALRETTMSLSDLRELCLDTIGPISELLRKAADKKDTLEEKATWVQSLPTHIEQSLNGEVPYGFPNKLEENKYAVVQTIQDRSEKSKALVEELLEERVEMTKSMSSVRTALEKIMDSAIKKMDLQQKTIQAQKEMILVYEKRAEVPSLQ